MFTFSRLNRRNLVTIMINENLTEWLVDLLEDNEELTDYSLEYAIALLMNLCLRCVGRAMFRIGSISMSTMIVCSRGETGRKSTTAPRAC